jgi:hypothetical protein
MASIINAATSGGLISTGDTSGQLQLQTGGTTALTVTSAQNVGIGTSTPDALLHVNTASGKVATFGNIVNNNGNYVVIAGSVSNKNWVVSANMIVGGEFGIGLTSTVGGTTIGSSHSFSITPAGYVTTPYQPSFYAWLTSGTFSTNGGLVPFNSVQFNVNNSYSTSTFKFTAPITGTYIFFAAGITNTGTTVEMGAYLNISTQVANCRNSGGSAGTNTGCSMTWTWNMNANDTMEIRLQGGGNLYGGGPFTNFGGYLIG